MAAHSARAALCESKRVWLLLHVSDFAVAVVGFLAGDESQPGTAEWDESWGECSQSGVTWGPVCAEPALRAWGEQVAARIRQAGVAGGGARFGVAAASVRW